MTTESGRPVERRTRSRDMIDKLLAERKEMLALYWQVAGLEPFSADKRVVEHLQEFCQVLVDYIAFGHFEVYDRIARGEERRSDVVALAEKIYPRIAAATDVAVEFNDKYDATDHELQLDGLSADLSKLGEELATRIELEDQLIGILVGSR